MDELQFEILTVCRNPMESELYTATLREHDIPHRARAQSDGSMVIAVPPEWLPEARQALERAEQIFFGNASGPTTDSQESGSAAGAPPPVGEEAAGLDFERWQLFDRDGPILEHELKTRPVWPARVLALVPGLGLGHLYAGRLQLFVYLVFASLLGVLFFAYTRSWASFLLNLFAWLIDLGFAPYHVREHNRRAERLRARQGASSP